MSTLNAVVLLIAMVTTLVLGASHPLPSSPSAGFIGDESQPLQVDNDARIEHARELLGSLYENSDVQLTEDPYHLEAFVRRQIRRSIWGGWETKALMIADTVIRESNRHQMDPIFVMAVIQRESRFNPQARGHHGEIGLMQIKPSTAEWIAKKIGFNWQGADSLEDPMTNIVLGTAYMSWLRQTFRNNGQLYVSAYNMGAANVRRLLSENIVPEQYKSLVMSNYADYYRVLSRKSIVARGQKSFRLVSMAQ